MRKFIIYNILLIARKPSTMFGDLRLNGQACYLRCDGVTHAYFVLAQECELASCTSATEADDTDNNVCKVCLDRRRDTLSIPCRHAAMCRQCAEEVKQRSGLCPICKGRIQGLETVRGTLQTFMPTRGGVR